MTENDAVIPTIYEGWHAYQKAILEAIKPLENSQLDVRAAPGLRSARQILTHMIGARARWFYLLMEEGGADFEAMGQWDHRGSQDRDLQDLVSGLERTWEGMQAAIARWTPEDWQKTWPGEGGDEPEILTRPWVIWHLIEHDLHHGGEVSITLGAHGIKALEL
jgi:uncharacterized damage-inducible protein DinB